jgi:histone-arginine methyltransferase CARM1
LNLNRSQTSFYGVDLTVLKPVAFEEYFKQPVVDTFDARIIIAPPVKHSIDFLRALESDLYNIDIPLKYDVQAATIVHGLAFWFDVAFNGSV